MLARLLTLFAIAVVVYVPAAQSAPAAPPTGLRGFLLRADELGERTFNRTPAFAWDAYDGAVSYDFELATSTKFDDRTVVWSTDGTSEPLRVPEVAIPLALPWMTGNRYALYFRVRAHTSYGATRWSAPFGFNMQWDRTPEQILPDLPGLVRWTPVEGATSYQVWFVEADKLISTTTTVADEREYYDGPLAATNFVTWRVRAVRRLYGGLPNGLPAVSYGPWSSTFVSAKQPVTPGPLQLVETVADTVNTSSSPSAHVLTPGFAFSGDTGTTSGLGGGFYRVYVSTDRQCVNTVFTGTAVASPAFAPRLSGPGDSAKTATAYDGEVVTPNEGAGSTGTPTPASSSEPAVTTTGNATAAIPAPFTATGPTVDLWDLGRPNARYWWTVVPVGAVAASTPPSSSSSTSTSNSAPSSSTAGTAYRDQELPQDACEAGRVMQFAKTTSPVASSATRPYVSGLSAGGELVAARTSKPSFYRTPLIAWKPTPGATGYEVQWSKTKVPFRSAATTPLFTAATSALLEGLAPGTWYYRVRGIDPYIPGPIKQMSWSKPVQVRVAGPSFVVQNGVTTKPAKQ